MREALVYLGLLLVALASGRAEAGPGPPPAALAGLPGAAPADDQPELRTWTAGQHQAQAVFLDLAEGEVALRRQDGQVVRVPLERLSRADQDYVRQVMETRARPQAGPEEGQGQPPPVRPAEASSAGAGDLTWLTKADVPTERVSEALQAVWEMPPDKAQAQVELFRRAEEAASGQGKRTAALLAAVALERADRKAEARIAYHELRTKAGSTPYGTSARFRLAITDEESDAQETCETLRDEPEADGWFLTPEGWTWTTTRQAALENLMAQRRDYLSVRLFDFFRERAPLSDPYRYVFALLGVTLGSTLLSLPWRVKVAAAGNKLARVRGEIQQIAAAHVGDPAGQQQALLALYKREGIDWGAGCVVFIVELVFVIWILIAMSNYSPQLALDEARFLWVPDVTLFSFHACLLWVLVVAILPLITGAVHASGQHPGMHIFGSVIAFAVITPIAWFWGWPAYVFVFWILQGIVGQVVFGILRGILMLRE